MPDNLMYLRETDHDGPRAIVPQRLFVVGPQLPDNDRKLWPYCCFVYGLLASQAEGFQMGTPEIAARLGISDSTVKKSLKVLEKYSLLKRLKRKEYRNHYRFCELKEWKIPKAEKRT